MSEYNLETEAGIRDLLSEFRSQLKNIEDNQNVLQTKIEIIQKDVDELKNVDEHTDFVNGAYDTFNSVINMVQQTTNPFESSIQEDDSSKKNKLP